MTMERQRTGGVLIGRGVKMEKQAACPQGQGPGNREVCEVERVTDETHIAERNVPDQKAKS